MSRKNLASMPDNDLDQFHIDLVKQKDQIKEDLRRVVTEQDIRAAKAEAQRKVDLMSDAERAALHQLTKPEGIPSEEKVSHI